MSQTELLVGAAEIDITPPLGTSLCGYFQDRKADGILDPLHAHAVVLELGHDAVALVSCDLISPSRRTTDRVREVVGATTNVPGPNVLIHCTHTHTGPILERRFLPDDAQLSQKVTSPGVIDDNYVALLPDLIAGAVRAAANDLRPAQGFGWGVGCEERIAFNRRYHMSDGSTRTNPGRLNPKIVEVAGPIDPDVLVLSFGAGSPALVNFAVHQDITGGCKISADMPCHMKRFLRGALGRDLRPIFFNGCCGDINHIDVTKETGDGYEHSVLMGQVLAGEVLKTLPWIEHKPVDRLGAAAKVLDVPLRRVTDEELEAARKILADPDLPTEIPEVMEVTEEQLKLFDGMWAKGTVALAETKAKSLPVEVQAMRIGDLGIVGLPGEMFVEHGLRIKERSPFAATLVAELANESHGYVPTQKAFEEGGYETKHRSAKLCEQAGDMMADAALELLNELK